MLASAWFGGQIVQGWVDNVHAWPTQRLDATGTEPAWPGHDCMHVAGRVMVPCPQVVEHALKVPSWHVYIGQQGSAGHGANPPLTPLVEAAQLLHRLLSTVWPRLFLHVQTRARESVCWPHVCWPHDPTLWQSHEYVMHTGRTHGSVMVWQAGT